MMNNFISEEINYCCDKQKIQNIAYHVNRKILSITTCMLIYIALFIASAILLNISIIYNVIPRIVWFVSGCIFRWVLDIVFGIELKHNITSLVLIEFVRYSINTTLILIVMNESRHLINTVKCNCYYGISTNPVNVNECDVYNGEVYCNEEYEEDEEDEDKKEDWTDVQDGISNNAQ